MTHKPRRVNDASPIHTATFHGTASPATLKSQSGMTLIELVITIIIIGIAAAALFTAMANITARSADPILRQQSLYIAEAYMEEVLLKPFPASTNCPVSNHGENRALFDDICDYNGLFYSVLPKAPRSVASIDPIDKLESYLVDVRIEEGELRGVDDALQITVTVTDPSGEDLQLVGWRTCYEFDAEGNTLCP